MIIHLITDLAVGGAELALYRLLAGLPADARAAQRVISMTPPGEVGKMISALGVPVESLGLKRGGLSPLAIFRLRRLLPAGAFVHAWMYHADLLAALAAPRRCLWSIHNGLDGFACEKPLTRLVILVLALLSFVPKKIVYVGARIAAQHERIGYARSKTVLIPHGFDAGRFHPDSAARGRLDVPTDVPVIGMCGRWDWSKDYPNFLEALGHVPDAQGVLIGTNVDENNAELKTLVRQHKLEGRVHLLGYRADVASLMPGFDLLCMCSRSEAGPIVVGEAMACGVPCVVTDVGDAAQMVGETGWVVEKENPRVLAGALRTALAAPDRAERGAQARARIEAQYTEAACISAYQRLYRALNWA